MSISRRELLAALSVAASAAPLLTHARTLAPKRDDDDKESDAMFAHGVASGDPLADRVILWTRVTLPKGTRDDDVEVHWMISLDPNMRFVVARDEVKTSAARDYTVKVDVDDLAPATTYFYQFRVGKQYSPIGRTKTLPVRDVNRVRLAVTSCSNYPYGFFNVYGMIGKQADLDAVLHLGDYIYEYANAQYGDGTTLNRLPVPDAETVALADYRARHALYKTDPDLKEAHRQHPWITVWDDHETTNNSWIDGAENHQPATEGSWQLRKQAAIKAYFEWMPIRQTRVQTAAFNANRTPPIYRRFAFGKLVELTMLDTRLIGRDQQPASPADIAAINNPNRQLLGVEQERWLFSNLVRSSHQQVQWRVIGQQVMMAQLSLDFGRSIANEDQWDGYRPARERLFSTLTSQKISNTVVLSGDIHSSWACDLTNNPFDTSYNNTNGSGSVGVEFITPGVSSPFLFPDTPAGAAQASGAAAQIRAISPHIRGNELFRRGYLVLDLDKERVQGEWIYAQTVQQRTLASISGPIFASATGSNHLVAKTSASSPRVNVAPLAP